MSRSRKPIRTLSRLAGGLLLLTLAGCFGQQSTPTNYYVLAYSPTDNSPQFEQPQFEEPAVVLEPLVDAVFDRRQIVRRVSPTQLQYMLNDLWAVSLPRAFQRIVREGLSETGAFSYVYYEGRDVDVPYRVAMEVSAVEIISHAEQPSEVHLELEMQLIEGNAVLSQSSLTHREQMETDAGPGDFVDEVSRLVSASVDELVNRATESRDRDGG